MKKLLFPTAAIALMSGLASALTIAETDTLDTGTLKTELSEILSFDGFQGTGTVVEVMLTLTGSVENDGDGVDDSTIKVTNNANSQQNASATTLVDFFFSSTDLSVGLTNPSQVNASTGLQSLNAGETKMFGVAGSEQSMDTFTGGDIGQFLTPFNIDVATLTGFSLSGGGGNISSDQTTFARGSVSVQYKVDNMAPIPLPASLPMLIGAMGGLGFLGWRRRKG